MASTGAASSNTDLGNPVREEMQAATDTAAPPTPVDLAEFELRIAEREERMMEQVRAMWNSLNVAPRGLRRRMKGFPGTVRL